MGRLPGFRYAAVAASTPPSKPQPTLCAADAAGVRAVGCASSVLHPAVARAVGTYLRNSGFNWSQRPGKLPLPAAANAIVAWHPGRAQQHSKQELDLVHDWQQRVRWPADGTPPVLPPELRKPRVLHAHKGVCCTRWLNKDRPLSPELQSALSGKLAAGGIRCSSGGSRGALGASAGVVPTVGNADT